MVWPTLGSRTAKEQEQDVNREVANLEALERREAEFQQLQERERESQRSTD